jgi:hypothetical protein
MVGFLLNPCVKFVMSFLSISTTPSRAVPNTVIGENSDDFTRFWPVDSNLIYLAGYLINKLGIASVTIIIGLCILSIYI